MVTYLINTMKIISQRQLVRNIENAANIVETALRNELSKISFLCTTANIWSSKTRSFFGITCHWINPHTYQLESATLSCQRINGTHDFQVIGRILSSVYRKFCIESKVVGCVTDNGSNFVKAFKNFGVDSKVSSHDVDEDVEEIEFCTIDLTDLYGSGILDFGNDLTLPLHFRCAAHTLNLLATSDMEKILKENEDLGKYHNSLIKKCTKLWNVSCRPKSAEVFEKYLKRKLPYPVTTRWNSLYDSLLVILENFSAIQIISEHLNLKEFSKEEEAYLDAYVLYMKPIAIGLDKLQENSYLAFWLPIFFSIRKRLLALFDHNVGMVRKLATNLYHHLQERFTKLLNLERTGDSKCFGQVRRNIIQLLKRQFYMLLKK